MSRRGVGRAGISDQKPDGLPPSGFLRAWSVARMELAQCGRFVAPISRTPQAASGLLAIDRILCRRLSGTVDDLPPKYPVDRYCLLSAID